MVPDAGLKHSYFINSCDISIVVLKVSAPAEAMVGENIENVH